ncbi:MAG TPA: response regulator [Steroidobacteraceae bacterium]
MIDKQDEESRSQDAALESAVDILAARQRVEEQLARTREELERRTQALAHSLGITRATIEATADGIVVTDHTGRIVDFNRNYLDMWRLERSQVEGRSYQEVLSHMSDQFADSQDFLERIGTVMGGADEERVDALRLADGRVFERLSKALLVEGRVAGRVWSFRDITEKVRAQEQLQELNETLEMKVAERTAALRETQQQFRQLVTGVNDCALYMLDPQGYIVSWNPGAERINGYTESEVIGRHFSIVHTDEDRAEGKPEQSLAIAAREGKYEAEGWRVRKDGTCFWASVLIDAIRDEAGQLIGFGKVTRDMTEKRAIQEQLHQSQKMEAIGQLTGGVAHDFNNLLTVILGNLAAIVRQLPPDNVRLRQAAEQAMHGAQRAATLTQQLLAFARRQPLNPKPTDVNRLVAAMTEMIRRTLGENISIETVLNGSLLTEVDAHQLESALLNLAVNARDAMPEGGQLTIETSRVLLDGRDAAGAEVQPGQYVLISISDTGVGMSAEVMQHAFDPFFTTKPVGKGTGLGLSQVFGFVKQSGGHIELHSGIGEGTTVKIYLPWLMQHEELEELEPTVPVPQGRLEETILVVEDDDDVRSYSTESLRELGFSVLEAYDGQPALRLLDHHPQIALMFTDVGLPGLNGRQLVDEAQRRRPGLKVLFTTGYARNAIMHRGRLDRGVELLTKPFSRLQLARRVREILDAPPPEPRAQRLAIVIEDEPLVRMFLADALMDYGFNVAQAASADEGAELASRLNEAEIAFIDVGLPDGNGIELARELRSRRPEMRIAIASGYGDQDMGRLREDPMVTFFSKPFDADAIKAAVAGIR